MEILRDHLLNGIEILFVCDHDCPSVTVMAIYKAGSRFETKKESGVAHLIEHNLFKGTKKRPSSKIISFEVENLGAHQNAYTSKDSTSYYIKGPKQNFSKMLDVFADMVQFPLFPKDELEKEKRVIMEEIKMYEDVPQDKTYDIFLEKLFPNNQLGENIAGTIKSVADLKVEDCQNFMHKYYSGKNLLLVVSESFDITDAKRQLEQKFANMEAGNLYQPELFLPKSIPDRKIQVSKDINQTHIVMGGYLHNYQTPLKERLPFYLGRMLLSGGMGSKLTLKIREELGLAYYLGIALEEFKEVGYYGIYLGVDHLKVREAVQAIISELKQFLSGDFSDQDLERARNLMIGNFIIFIETSDDAAGWYGSQIAKGQTLVTVEDEIEMVKKTTRFDVITAWGKWLRNDNMQIVTYGNNKQDLNGLGLD